ncbi:unnamed protein product [Didymodactylos carnosus]|uniref:Sialin n=1 Tax=Didymodactylos carnosus TaxID=1234261 RepID=A0A8S2D1B5_9BILA|nr:unnamed protein product [Didymodactylos carnosus]CAF3561393.1 unnamed protein product [Didymodactylos carnosus]
MMDDNDQGSLVNSVSEPLLENYHTVQTHNPRDGCCKNINARYVIATWAFMGFICLYALRVNLSVAIVAMVTPQSVLNQSVTACPGNGNHSDEPIKHHYEFTWSPKTQGLVLGSFFYGYLFTQIIGGNLAERFGAKWIYGCNILIAGFLTLLTPLAARTHVVLLIIVRLLIGVFEGPSFPSAGALWGRWIPPMERSVVPPIALSGVLTIIWFCGWSIFTSSSPSEHPRISIKEKNFLLKCIPQTRKLRTPWKLILYCVPLWAIAVMHICVNFVYYVLLTSLPIYFSTILRFDLHQNGLMFAIPYVFQLIVTILSGQLADLARSRRILSTTAVRKIQTIIGGIGSSLFLILVGYIGCNRLYAIICITCAVACIGFHSCGSLISHLDIASNYAGTLVGLTNTLATIPGFVGPYFVGAVTNNNQTLAAWRVIFNVSAGIGLFGTIVYCLLFNGEEQKWNREYENQNEQND